MKPYLCFLHIPKAGGNSIKKFLVEASSRPDFPWRGVIKLEDKLFLPNGQQFICYGHSNPFKLIPRLRCYTFCFFRNPYERAVSSYHYFRLGGNQSPEDVAMKQALQGVGFVEFLRRIKQGLYKDVIHLHPQSVVQGFAANSNYVGKCEPLAGHLKYVLKSNDLPLDADELSYRENSTNHKPFASYYDDEARAIIESVYGDDINRFNYQCPS